MMVYFPPCRTPDGLCATLCHSQLVHPEDNGTRSGVSRCIPVCGVCLLARCDTTVFRGHTAEPPNRDRMLLTMFPDLRRLRPRSSWIRGRSPSYWSLSLFSLPLPLSLSGAYFTGIMLH